MTGPQVRRRCPPEGDGHGAWDADRLAQVVGNLVRNAVSYGAPGAAITVRNVGSETTVTIHVHNHGKAIAGDVLPTLFEPFKRGERRQDSERSVGLGLFIVREIVTAHGGSVEVRSDPDDGTSFQVCRPQSPEVEDVDDVEVVEATGAIVRTVKAP